MATFFTVGTLIEILKTDNVVSRFPELIGALGVVDMAPIHPSTWFTIKVIEGGRLVKLQTTAMKPLVPEKASSRPTVIQQSPIETTADKPVSVILPEHIEHRPRALSNVGIAHFVKGVAVKILGTNNVLQRVPHLVGMVGNIKDVPVHPITWFKIEFPSGQVVTFRPSAFKLDDGRDEVIVPKVQKKVAAPTAHETKKVIVAAKDNESDFSVGMRVRIRSGELSGATGEIMRFGNGWIQVLTSEGKIAKRAHELDFVDGSSRPSLTKVSRSNVSVVGHAKDSTVGAVPDFDSRRSKSGRLIKTFPQYSPTEENGLDDFDKSHQAKRQRSNSESHDSSENNFPCNYPSQPYARHSKSNAIPRSVSRNSTFQLNNLDACDLDVQSANCPFPLISLQLRQAKRVQTQEYVDRESTFSDGRPDLSYWLDRIRGAIFDKDCISDSESMYDSSSVSDSNEASQDLDEMKVEMIVDEDTLPQHPDPDDHVSIPVSIEAVSTIEEDKPEKDPTPIAATSHTPYYIPKKQSWPRSDSVCETDCEDSLSPDLTALGSSLVQHQLEVKPSMLTPMLLPPPNTASIHPSKSMIALYDNVINELCPARFFISTASVQSPRESALSKDLTVHLPKDHDEWTSFFPLPTIEPTQSNNPASRATVTATIMNS